MDGYYCPCEPAHTGSVTTETFNTELLQVSMKTPETC